MADVPNLVERALVCWQADLPKRALVLTGTSGRHVFDVGESCNRRLHISLGILFAFFALLLRFFIDLRETAIVCFVHLRGIFELLVEGRQLAPLPGYVILQVS